MFRPINRLIPFISVVFSVSILKEYVSWRQILCLIIAFPGCALVIRPGMQSGETANYLLGVSGSITVGLAYTCLRYATESGMKSQVVVFNFSFLTTCIALPLFVLNFQPMTPYQLAMLVLAGRVSPQDNFQ